MKRCVVGICRAGEPEGGAAKDAPTVWLPSLATMAAVLSEANQSRLRLIRDQQSLIAAMRSHKVEVVRLLGEIEALVGEVQS